MENNVTYEEVQEEQESHLMRDIWEIFINEWKWFVVSVGICVGVGFIYVSKQQNIYKRSAVMLVKEDSNSPSSSKSRMGTDALMQLNGVMMGSSVKDEVYILQSHQILKEVVQRLNLDVYYSCRCGLKTVSLYDEKPFTAVFYPERTKVPYSFKVTLEGNTALISDLTYGKEEYDEEWSVTIGKSIELPFGRLTLKPNIDNLTDFDGKTINVTHVSPDVAAFAYGGSVSTNEMDKQSTLVNITCKDNNIQRADDILNTILQAYKESIINDKNLIAQSTAKFIDERIELINHDLMDVEGRLAQFKEENNIMDFKANASAFIQQQAEAQKKSIELEAQVGVLDYLLENLRNHANQQSLIPTLGGLADAPIQQQIVKYNELMLERNRLASNTGEGSVRMVEADKNLAAMRKAIIASTTSYKESLLVQVAAAKKTEQTLDASISSVPKKEQKALDIQREQDIKSTLYTYLLNKREETALQLAITEANIRIVEQPFGVPIPIAPKRKIIMLIALLLGVVIPFIFFYLKNLLNVAVRGRRDVEEGTNIPILGEIPHYKGKKGDTDILVAASKNDGLNEAFRMLRYNLKFISKDAQVIMFTSTTPNEGKSFISRNFAETLAVAGKKVILVDSDIRKSTQSRLVVGKKTNGLTTYLCGSTNDVPSLIATDVKDSHFDMITTGPIPPNPSELLMSPRLDDIIAQLKTMYDYVIIDNVPAQVVADAGIVNRVADLTVYVMRCGVMDRRYLPELERLYQQKRFTNLCLVLNDVMIEKKRYGYGYGYGYAGLYGNDKG